MVAFAANAGIYGLAVFVAGFVFGMIREMVLIPRFGPQQGSMIEFAVMIAAVTLIARFVVTRLEPNAETIRLLGLGVLGTIVLVMFESAFAMGVMGQPTDVYLESYDMSRGALFPIGLLVVLLAPLTIGLMDKAFGGKAGSE